MLSVNLVKINESVLIAGEKVDFWPPKTYSSLSPWLAWKMKCPCKIFNFFSWISTDYKLECCSTPLSVPARRLWVRFVVHAPHAAATWWPWGRQRGLDQGSPDYSHNPPPGSRGSQSFKIGLRKVFFRKSWLILF